MASVLILFDQLGERVQTLEFVQLLTLLGSLSF